MKLSHIHRSALILGGAVLILASPIHADTTTNADNSGNNMVDRDTQSITPASQSNASADVAITRKIRRAVVRDKSISMDGHNVKIITTKDHVVYLRGVCASDDECKKIAAIAQSKVGDYQLKNELTTANK